MNEGVFRQSHIVLILRLVLTEIILLITYLFIRIPKVVLFSPDLGNNVLQFAYWAGIVYFLFLTTLEMILILRLVLSWANEIWEIKNGIIFHRRGILRMEEDSYSLKNLGSVTISQSILGKILNFGTIKIYSPILKQDFFLVNIHNPKSIIKMLEDEISGFSQTSNIIPKRN